MANLKDVIYLSAEDYNTLYTNGTVTINGVTLTYDANNVYIVPDDTDAKISSALADYIAKSSTSGLVKNDGTIDTSNYATTSQLPSTMGASGSSHSSGLVPDTPSTAGTTKFLREDGSWQTPPNTTYSASDFDIKDLADSTSLRSTWNNKLSNNGHIIITPYYEISELDFNTIELQAKEFLRLLCNDFPNKTNIYVFGVIKGFNLFFLQGAIYSTSDIQNNLPKYCNFVLYRGLTNNSIYNFSTSNYVWSTGNL